MSNKTIGALTAFVIACSITILFILMFYFMLLTQVDVKVIHADDITATYGAEQFRCQLTAEAIQKEIK